MFIFKFKIHLSNANNVKTTNKSSNFQFSVFPFMHSFMHFFTPWIWIRIKADVDPGFGSGSALKPMRIHITIFLHVNLHFQWYCHREKILTTYLFLLSHFVKQPKNCSILPFVFLDKINVPSKRVTLFWSITSGKKIVVCELLLTYLSLWRVKKFFWRS